MTPGKAQTLVVTSLGVTALVTVGSDLAEGHLPGVATVVGLGITGVGLSVAAELAPDLAGPFAVLVMVTSVFVFGGPLANRLTSIVHPQQQRSRRP